MKTQPFLLHALSPIHAGTGHAVDVIDLPIARQRATGIPFVPGSSLKGVLRERHRTTDPPDTWRAIFGPDTANASDHAGALGAGLNARSIPELGAPIICGAANNQLETEEDGARLQARGVTYAPDYVVNAGGIISVSAEYLGESEAAVDARVRAIAPRLMKVLETAKAEGLTPHQAADRIVRERIAAAKKN